MSPVSLSAVVDEAARLIGPRAVRDEPIGARTTYRAGGTAELFVVIDDHAVLSTVAHAVTSSGVAVTILGNGSNTLVSEAGIPGLVVMLGGELADVVIGDATDRPTMTGGPESSTGPEARTVTVHAGGGAALPTLARRASSAGIAGLEWAVGVPGTVGGAVAMNAGGHGAMTSDHLVEAHLVDLATGVERHATASSLDFSYRRSNVRPTELLVEATLAGASGNPLESGARIAEIVRWRREHQPGGRNAGSVFTNPPESSAGALIEACGLKGYRIGSAEVSPKHANFIQLDAGGSSDDVLRLIAHVRDVVARETGVTLSTEVRIIGAQP